MVTLRGLRSTISPRLASSYSFFPFIFIAEYMGGIWLISPRNPFAAAISSSFDGRVSQVFRTLPVVSCVSVETPSRSPAIYSLLSASANSTARVALPANTTSRPVAIGSSVPE